jgi:ferredoxin
VRVQIDSEKCQGHGRCYDLAPEVFTDDEEGYGQVIGDGTLTPDNTEKARLAVDNCPEGAISIVEED